MESHFLGKCYQARERFWHSFGQDGDSPHHSTVLCTVHWEGHFFVGFIGFLQDVYCSWPLQGMVLWFLRLLHLVQLFWSLWLLCATYVAFLPFHMSLFYGCVASFYSFIACLGLLNILQKEYINIIQYITRYSMASSS